MIIQNYCRALAGRDVELEDSKYLVNKKIGWIDADLATTDGRTIYLPGLSQWTCIDQESFDLVQKLITSRRSEETRWGENIFAAKQGRVRKALQQNHGYLCSILLA